MGKILAKDVAIYHWSVSMLLTVLALPASRTHRKGLPYCDGLILTDHLASIVL